MSNVSDDERLVVLLEARIRDFEKNMQKASGTAGREFGRMRQDARSATAQMEADMARSTSRMNQALAGFSTRIGAMASAFAPMTLGVGAAGAAVVAFGAQARQVSSEIAQIGAEAKRAGIDVKAFQELKFVADQNKVSIDALTDGIKEMNLRADEFILTGKGSGAEAFQRLGLTATDLAKKLKDPSALFTEIIGKLEHMDRAAQIRIADEVFGGTGGEQFVQLIDRGADGIRRTIDEANRLGIVMDEDLIQKATEIDRQFNRIAQTVGTTLKSAVVEVTHLVSGLFDGLRDVENRQLGTLQSELEAIAEQSAAIRARIAEMKAQDAEGFGFFSNANEIKLANAQLADLTAQAEKLRGIIDQRTGSGAAEDARELGDALEYVDRNGGAAAETVDTYGKSVSDLRARLAGSVKELQLQNDMLGQSEGALAAAQFEARAMADALRAAQAAGKDVVDPALASFISAQAAEYGRLTDQIAASTEAEKERQRVNDRAREQTARVSQFEADLAFERSILRLPDAEQQIRTTIRGLGVEFDSFEGQRIADAMRYNAVVREQQGALRETGSIVDDLGDSFADVFAQATRDGDDFFASFLRGLAGIGNQLAAASAKNLLGRLFNVPSAANDSSGNIGGFVGSVLPAANSNVPAFVPTPTAAMRQSSMRLAEGVTESVSDTLLKNMLTAGKSDSHVTGLNREFATALTTMFGDAPSAVRSAVSIYSGFRSVERQAQLFSAAVKKYGSEAAARKWVAPPGRSNHNGGMAADLQYASPAARSWMHENAGRYGLSFPMGHEPWHIELAKARGGARTAIAASPREVQASVSRGVEDGLAAFAGPAPSAQATTALNAGWSGFGPMPGGTGLFSQNGLGVLGGVAGLFGSGYASGNPLMGGASGAMGGLQLGGAIASAFPALAGFGGPIGMGVGAIAGCIGGKFGKRERIAA